MDAHRAAENAARTSYGRLVAFLSARSRDLAAAEDALGEAFRAALETWPENGVPEKPEAWLLTVARSRLVDRARRAAVRADAEPTLEMLAEDVRAAAEMAELPDDRLRLLFICAHPAIDAAARTPLMLQTVLGLDAARIAAAFCVSAASMGQRLVRAKAKIRLAGIAFEMPAPSELRERLGAVLDAIYVAYGTGWDDVTGADPRRQGLTEEAIWLARLVAQLVPDDPEALGLLALVLHCEARREARRGTDGAYVPLSEQDVVRWSRSMIEEAERHLAAAARHATPARFQLEAAIQSVHAHRAVTGRTGWDDIVLLYDELVRLEPALGAKVARAAALAEARGPAAGLEALDALPPRSIVSYEPYWAVRAHLLAGLGMTAEAHDAYERAASLSDDLQVRSFLARRAEEMRNRRAASLPGEQA